MAIDFSKVPEQDRKTIAEHFGTQAPAAKAKPANKFNAVKTAVGDRVFDSGREASRYVQLEAMERTGLIRNLERQVELPLSVNGILLGYYKCDYRYVNADGATVVEDAKGRKTEMYRWKRKHVAAEHGITILET